MKRVSEKASECKVPPVQNHGNAGVDNNRRLEG